MKKLIILFLVLTVHTVARAVTRISCIGASITYGATLPNPGKQSYPAQLQAMLGTTAEVHNFGVSGTTLLRNGDQSYWKTREYKEALNSKPDVVFIDLGGNDSKLVNRGHLNELEQNCLDMIRSFSQLPSHPRVIVLLPVPSFQADTSQIYEATIVNAVIPKLRHAAYLANVEVLDMHSCLINHKELFSDGIHPDVQGSNIMAQKLYQVLKQKRDAGYDFFSKLKQPFHESDYYGYKCAEFSLNGRECKVVEPKFAAAGHPWIWRARFWGHEPQTEIALLEQGFYVVYCDVAELLGNDEAISHWDSFYKLITDAGLAGKGTLEGMSRGGIYVYNWAAAHPARVSCVYVDNALLDLKYWPDSVVLKQDFKLKYASDISSLKASPLDKTEQIASGKFPMLHLLADADEEVSPEKNTLLFESKMEALGAHVTVIHKHGFKHHPHSLPNPEPIVSFILKATGYQIIPPAVN